MREPEAGINICPGDRLLKRHRKTGLRYRESLAGVGSRQTGSHVREAEREAVCGGQTMVRLGDSGGRSWVKRGPSNPQPFSAERVGSPSPGADCALLVPTGQ